MNRQRALWLGSLALLALATAWLALPVAETLTESFGAPVMMDRQGSSIVDHAVRVHRGLPIYVEPDAHFCPLLYMPLYYYMGGAAMALAGESLETMRALSLALALVSLLVMALVVRRVTNAWWATALVVPLALAAHPGTGFYIGLPRVDAASSFFLIVGIAIAALGRGAASGAALALAFLLAFWSKQTVALPVTLMLGAMLLTKRRPAVLAIGLLAVAVPASLLLADRFTDGWFWTFVGDASGKEPFAFGRLLQNLAEDWLVSTSREASRAMGALFVPLLVVAPTAVLLRRRWRGDEADRRLLQLLVAFAALAAYTLVSRARLGGSPKALLPISLLLAGLLPVAIWWLGQRFGNPARSLAVLALAALVLDAHFAPSDVRPTEGSVREWQRFIRSVERYAAEGQVWAAPWGYLTTPMEGQAMRPSMAEMNHYLGFTLPPRNPTPPALAAAIEAREFRAIFLSDRPAPYAFADLLATHYRKLPDERYELQMGARRLTLGVDTFVPVSVPTRTPNSTPGASEPTLSP